MTAIQIGDVGVARVLIEFARAGINVYVPVTEGTTADLIADFGGRPQRVQVKTTEIGGDSVSFHLTSRTASRGRRAYTAVEVDWYALVSLAHDSVLLIPYSGARAATVRYAPRTRPSGRATKYTPERDGLTAVLARL